MTTRKKTTTKTEKEITDTAVAVVSETNSIAQFIPALFNEVNFNDLNQTIDALGNNSNVLSDQEKRDAVSIIDSWQENVIERLRIHNSEVSDFVNFFDASSSRYSRRIFTEDQEAALAEKTDTVALYKKYIELDQKFEELLDSEPERPYYDESTSQLEILKLRNDYEVVATDFKIKRQKLERDVNLAYKGWIKAASQDSEIKESISKAKKYVRNVDKLINDCKTKTDLAKLNIKIGSKEIRASLKGLMDFAINI